MRKSKNLRTLTYSEHLHEISKQDNKVNQQEINGMIDSLERLGNDLNHTAPLLYAIDYTTGRYLLFTDAIRSITNESPEAFLEGGIPKLIDVYQKEDFKVYNEQIFTRNKEFLAAQPANEHHRYIFSYNFRVRHRNGSYVPIYQRGFYISSPDTGQPLYSWGMVMDISPFKKDRVISHSIEKTTPEGNSLLQQHYYFPDEEDKLLSFHERRILQYMSEGLSGKQIADLLHITENTVANHRKNLLRKTNTKNVAELVAFGCRSGLI
ncbi:response regulator transcription factor [Nostoc ellipsosporum NOK]|nr:response regulator transcription factor [Nostoc ellipsosporum NOK]